jgi:hypothetical protein
MGGINIGSAGTLYQRVLQHPFETEQLAQTAFAFLASGTTTDNITDAIHYQEFIPSMTVEFLEVCFEVGDGFKNCLKAAQDLDDMVRAFQKKNRYPFNLTMQFRFNSGRTRALMSPQYYKQDPTQPFVAPELCTPFYGPIVCFVEILCKQGTQGWADFTREMGDKWFNLPGARPHWPKQFDTIPNYATRMQEQWDNQGKCLDHFLRVRKLLRVDPYNMFVNHFLEGVLFTPLVNDQKHEGWNERYQKYWVNNAGEETTVIKPPAPK